MGIMCLHTYVPHFQASTAFTWGSLGQVLHTAATVTLTAAWPACIHLGFPGSSTAHSCHCHTHSCLASLQSLGVPKVKYCTQLLRSHSQLPGQLAFTRGSLVQVVHTAATVTLTAAWPAWIQLGFPGLSTAHSCHSHTHCCLASLNSLGVPWVKYCTQLPLSHSQLPGQLAFTWGSLGQVLHTAATVTLTAAWPACIHLGFPRSSSAHSCHCHTHSCLASLHSLGVP